MDSNILKEIKLDDEVQKLFNEIQQLKKVAENKLTGMEKFKRDYAEREQKLIEVKSQANEALGKGADPLQYTCLIGQIEADLKGMSELLPGPYDQPDYFEREQIMKKEKQISSILKVNFNKSVYALKKREELKRKLKDIFDIYSDWENTQKQLCSKYQINFHSSESLNINDEVLARWVRNILGNLRSFDHKF